MAGFFENEIAGDTSINRHNLMHIDQFGAPDFAFDPQADGPVIRALAYDQATNTLYVGGDFTTIGGGAHAKLAAIDGTTGAEIPAFNAVVNGGDGVHALVLSGTNLYVGGFFTDVDGVSGVNTALIDVSGGAPVTSVTFKPNPNGTVSTMAVTATRIFFGGNFVDLNAVPNTRRFGATDLAGTVDAAFTPRPDNDINALATDGTSLWAAGAFTKFDTTNVSGLAKLAVAGTGVPQAFPELNAGGLGLSLALQGPWLYVGGTYTTVGGAAHANFTRVDAASGTVDTANWDTGGPVYGIAATADWAYSAGQIVSVQWQSRHSLMELDLDNGGVRPLSHDFNAGVNALYVNNGTLYVGGDFTQVDGVAHPFAVAIDLATGALITWPQAAAAPDAAVNALAQGNNSSVLIGGNFAAPQAHAAAIGEVGQPNAGQDTGWAPALDGNVNALASDGVFYYVGGAFTHSGATTRNHLAAFSAGTTLLDANWDPNPDSDVYSFAVTPAGVSPAHIYVGGNFANIGGAARADIAQLEPAGGVATGAASSWNANANNIVRALALSKSGLVYAGGDFTTIGAKARTAVGALDPATAVANNWDPGLCCGVESLGTYQFDERVYVGGTFRSTKYSPATGFAVYSEPPLITSGALAIDDPVAGQSATCSLPVLGGSFPQTEQTLWKRDGTDIPGSLGSFSWTPTDADVGHQLSCYLVVTNLGYTASYTSPGKTVAARPAAPGGAGSPQGAQPTPTTSATPVGTPTQTASAGDIDGELTPPPPQLAKSVIVEPTQGLVTVLLPGAKTAIPLPDAERIPVGSIVDATRGRVRLTTVGAGGKLQSADFFGGKFLIAQAPGAKPMVDLKLRGGSFKACPSLKHTSKGARGAAKRKNKAAPSTSIRHLWGEGAGLFRTEGRYASATIRGTTWLTDDRCDGTLVRVTKGAVTVRDVSKRKSLALKAPKQYLARAG